MDSKEYKFHFKLYTTFTISGVDEKEARHMAQNLTNELVEEIENATDIGFTTDLKLDE